MEPMPQVGIGSSYFAVENLRVWFYHSSVHSSSPKSFRSSSQFSVKFGIALSKIGLFVLKIVFFNGSYSCFLIRPITWNSAGRKMHMEQRSDIQTARWLPPKSSSRVLSAV